MSRKNVENISRDAVYKVMRRNGMNIDTLAQALMYERASSLDYMLKIGRMPTRKAQKLAEILGVEVDDLCEKEVDDFQKSVLEALTAIKAELTAIKEGRLL